MSSGICENKGFVEWDQNTLLSFQPCDRLITLTTQKPEQWPRDSECLTQTLPSTESRWALQLPVNPCSWRWRPSRSVRLWRVPNCYWAWVCPIRARCLPQSNTYVCVSGWEWPDRSALLPAGPLLKSKTKAKPSSGLLSRPDVSISCQSSQPADSSLLCAPSLPGEGWMQSRT